MPALAVASCMSAMQPSCCASALLSCTHGCCWARSTPQHCKLVLNAPAAMWSLSGSAHHDCWFLSAASCLACRVRSTRSTASPYPRPTQGQWSPCSGPPSSTTSCSAQATGAGPCGRRAATTSASSSRRWLLHSTLQAAGAPRVQVTASLLVQIGFGDARRQQSTTKAAAAPRVTVWYAARCPRHAGHLCCHHWPDPADQL